MRNILVIDFEATCWDKDLGVKPAREPYCSYPNEIIEFGVVLYSTEKKQVLGEFQSFVKPTFHPQLTDFCTELTSITQQNVDSAPPFSEVLAQFVDTFDIKGDITDPMFCSMGDYDRYQLIDDCFKHSLDYPFAPGNHQNIKPLYREIKGVRKKSGRAIMNALDLEWQGTQHRGIDDARNYVRIIEALGWRL
ncbi:MAG: exonuclease [Kangiella sp.]|nr:MAG: exonuclease [Kangiella sp.]